MALDPRRLVGEPGWITGPEPLARVSRSTVRNWVAAGRLVRLAPDAYAERRRAAGLPVTAVERAVVDSWGSVGGSGRADVRAAAITAVRRRMCRASDLTEELARSIRLPGRADLGVLVALLADGCRSELEIWGCLHVLRAPGMPTFVQQRRVVVGGEVFVLDAACEESMLAGACRRDIRAVHAARLRLLGGDTGR